MIRVGNFEISSVVTGRYRLDGGAMFGVVPKVLWARTEEVDASNRIAMVMRSLLAVDRATPRVVLVDTGAGDQWTPDQAARFAIENDPSAIASALARFGLREESVTDVVITHLHFDHAGGMTRWTDGERATGSREDASARGRTRLRFPNARHWVHEAQWAHAHAPTERDRASFLARDWAALEGSDRLCVLCGGSPEPPCPGIRWLVSNGHTPGQLLPRFADGQTEILFAGDLIPTSTHLPVPWVMAYDLFPVSAIEEKREVLRRCVEEGLMLAFPHDRRMGGARVRCVGKHPEAEPLDLEIG